MRAAAALLALLVATAAGAQTPTPTAVPRGFLTGFAAGNVGSPIWTTGGTAPTTAWVSASSHWAMRVAPADNTASYGQVSVSGSGDNGTLAITVRIPTFPASGENRLAEVRLSGGTMGILTIGADRKVRAYFGDQQKECTSNSLYKFSTCTTDAECPVDVGGNPGESACGAATFATSDAIAASIDTVLALVQAADSAGARPADVKLSLYRDGVPRGSKTRWQGTCGGSTSGLIDGKACGATADCTALCAKVGGCSSGGTCSFSGVGAATAFRLGTTLADAKAMDVYFLDAKFAFSATDASIRYSKVVPLWPSGDSTPIAWGQSGCGSAHADCLDDTDGGGAIDDDTTRLSATGSGDTDVWALDDYTLGGGEQAVAVVAYGHTRRTVNDGLLQLGLKDGASGSEVVSHTVVSAYQTFLGPLLAAMPGGGAIVPNNLRGFTLLEGTQTSRITNFVAELEVGLAAPAPPGIFPDVNGDGARTLCMVGDSIFNDPMMYEALNGTAIDPENILRCAMGGRKIGDLYNNWSNVVDGSPSGNYPCVAERGEHAKCDIAFVHIGANNFGAGTVERTDTGTCYQRGCVGGSGDGQACTTDATCGGGTCTDDVGPEYGDPCQIASGTESQDGRSWITSSHCIRGNTIGSCCLGFCATSRCGGAGICSGGSAANTLCTSDATCTGGGTCVALGGNGANTLDDLTTGYGSCARGDVTSPECPLGVCVRRPATSYYAATFEALIEAAAARTGSSAVKLVLVGNSEPCADLTGRTHCVGGANHRQNCSGDGDCPSGACKITGDTGGWNQGLEVSRWLQSYLRSRAAESDGQLRYIGLGPYLRRKAGRTTPDANLRDCIHLNDAGQTAAAELVVACLTEDSVPENECGTW